MSFLLNPQSAAEFTDFHNFGVFDIRQIKKELQALKKLLPKEISGSAAVETDKFEELIRDFCISCGPDQPGTDTLCVWVRKIDNQQAAALKLQIDRVLKAIAYAIRMSGTEYSSPKTLLLPVLWAERMELILGFGYLPVAWVISLDILKF